MWYKQATRNKYKTWKLLEIFLCQQTSDPLEQNNYSGANKKSICVCIPKPNLTFSFTLPSSKTPNFLVLQRILFLHLNITEDNYEQLKVRQSDQVKPCKHPVFHLWKPAKPVKSDCAATLKATPSTEAGLVWFYIRVVWIEEQQSTELSPKPRASRWHRNKGEPCAHHWVQPGKLSGILISRKS